MKRGGTGRQQSAGALFEGEGRGGTMECRGCAVDFGPKRKDQKYHSTECRRSHQHSAEKRARARLKKPKSTVRKPRLGTKANPLIVARCAQCGILYSPARLPESSLQLCARCNAAIDKAALAAVA
jgi:hypothetical protein